MKSVVPFFLFAAFVVGCSKEHQQLRVGGKKMATEDVQTSGYMLPDTWFARALSGAKLDCVGDCPSSIGMVGFFETDYGEETLVEQCTGFLVAENIFATNSHCVPEKVRAGDVECTSAMGIAFPNGTAVNDVRICKKILQISSVADTFDLDDYVFIEIAPLARQPVSLSQSGVADALTVSVHKINPRVDGQLGGTYETQICATVQNSLLNLFYIDKFSRTALAVGCRVMGGNSGSPVTNEQGEVIGLLQSRKVSDYLYYLGDQLARKNNLVLPELPPEHFVFSNMACIPDPVTGDFEKQQCDYFRYRSLAFIFNNLVDASVDEFDHIVGKWKAQLPVFFDYYYEQTKGFASIFTATPKCVRLDLLGSTIGKTDALVFSDFLRVVKEYEVDEHLRFRPHTKYVGDEIFNKYKLDLTTETPKLFKEFTIDGKKQFQATTIKSCPQ
jgi:hypothetical protein